MSKSPTYVYRDYRENFIVARNLLEVVTQNKAETWRLGNERSEDAVSWNVFVSLAKLRRLGTLFKLLTGIEPAGEPELYLWGNRIDTQRPEPWRRLSDVRERLESKLRIKTEPDVMLRVPRQAIVLVEAKFGSGNGTLDGSAKRERFGCINDFLTRYQSPPQFDPLNRAWIRGQEPKCVLEQLCRNVVFAHWLAEESEVAWVVNLVRDSSERDVETAMAHHLTPLSKNRFRRLTWEEIYQSLTELTDADVEKLLRYMENKTIGLEPAFRITRKSNPATGR